MLRGPAPNIIITTWNLKSGPSSASRAMVMRVLKVSCQLFDLTSLMAESVSFTVATRRSRAVISLMGRTVATCEGGHGGRQVEEEGGWRAAAAGR